MAVYLRQVPPDGNLRRIAEVDKLDMAIDKGKVVAYRVRLDISFKHRVNWRAMSSRNMGIIGVCILKVEHNPNLRKGV